MSKLPEFEISKKFNNRVEQGDLTDDIKFVYRIAGGMPLERVEEEFRLSGSGKVKVMVRDMLKKIVAEEASDQLNQPEIHDLFQKIGQSLDSLFPRSEAHFLPDSLVGSITIQVSGEEATLYFLVDEEERVSQDKPIAPQMVKAIQHFTGISQRLLKEKRGGRK